MSQSIEFEDEQVSTNSNRAAFGIRTKLFIAFCGFAGLTVIATLVAWLVFMTIEESVDEVTQHSVPGMVDALALAKKVADIASAAPKLANSHTHEGLSQEQTSLALDLKEFARVSAALDRGGYFSGQDTKISENVASLSERLEALHNHVNNRITHQHQRQERASLFQAAHSEFSETLEPIIDDAVFSLVVSGEQLMVENTASTTNLVEDGINGIDQLLSISAAINLAAGLIAEAAAVTESVHLQPIQERFLSAAFAIDRGLSTLPDNARTRQLTSACEQLLSLGRGVENVFSMRMAQLAKAKSNNGVDSSIRQHLDKRHADVLLLLTPLVDDASFDLVLATERVTGKSRQAISGLIEGNVNTLSIVLTLRAEGNLAASLLSEVSVIRDEQRLTPLEDRFIATQGRIAALLKQAKDKSYFAKMAKVTQALLAFGIGDHNMFALRRLELQEDQAGQIALDQSRASALELGNRVAEFVNQAQSASDLASVNSKQAISTGQVMLLLITVAGLIGASAAMFLYVGPRILKPISRITSAMTELAEGDTSVDIPARDRSDELGNMARALGVFRDNAIAVQEANMKEIQSTRRQLAEAIESINEGFCFFDADDRLVVCNSRYHQLVFPGTEERVEPGSSFESVVQRAVKLGLVMGIDDEAQWIKDRLAKHRMAGQPHIQQNSDGCYLMISERRTEEGGTVGIYSDITELKQRETELGQKSKELERLASQLSKYLSPQVYESIFTGRQEVKVNSRRKKLTVFFSDIADFTATAERLQSEDLTYLLNEYLTEMSKIALNYGATIDKYVGDAIVIFIGDPESKGVQQDALNCVEMAVAMRSKMDDLRANWRDRGIENPLQCRMGINTGYCTVGNFGSEARMDYTIIGAGVNLASRLETAAAPGEILLSHETYALVKKQAHCEMREPIKIKGVGQPVASYRVIDLVKNLESLQYRVREEHLNLRLEMNPAAMSDSEREEAEAALSKALAQLRQE